jgi:subtilisin family serine protease
LTGSGNGHLYIKNVDITYQLPGEVAGGDSGDLLSYPVMYPAKYPEVIAVGAQDVSGNVAPFSNSGPEVDVLAPGTDIVSLDLGFDNFGICSGTSMATPHVTGSVALMLSSNDTLSPAEVKSILTQTAVGGELNLIGALEAAK